MAYAMDTWADTVYHIALSHAKSVPDAKDIAQDVFVKLLKGTLVFESDEQRGRIFRCMGGREQQRRR